MNFPILTFLRTVFIHLSAALMGMIVCAFIFNAYLEFNLQLWQALVAISVGFMIGPIHGVIEGFLVERYFVIMYII